MYAYQFNVVRVVDGDTVDVRIDLGFNTVTRQRVRLLGIDTPEIRGQPDEVEEIGRQATQWLTDRLTDLEATLWLESQKGPGKYGRYLVTLYDGDVNINQQMVDLGLAWPYGEPKDLAVLKRKQMEGLHV